MQQTLRPYTTAGVAIVGASLIAITPVTAPLPGVPAFRDVVLTADGSALGDSLQPWIDQYNTAAQNATTLVNNFALAPFVGYQQEIANQGDFWSTILNDPSTIQDQIDLMQQHQNAVADGYTLFETGPPSGLSGAGDAITDMVTDHTLSGEQGLDLTGNTLSVIGHKLLLSFLPTMLPADLDADQIQPLLNFLASPMSGIIMGALGPALSPWVAMSNSIADGDSFNEIMANMVGAYFNGADLNLDFLAPLINESGLLPEGTVIYNIDLALGGLLTPGVVASAANLVPGTADAIAAPGGSILNSLGLNLDVSLLGITLPAEVPSHAVGPIGAWEGWMQSMGVLLGSGWSGKGNPQDAVAPLTGFELPQVPDDFFDDGGMGSAAAVAADAGAAMDWSDLADLLGI